MSAWIIRAGRHGEREQWCLDHNAAGGGFREVPDLTGVATKDELRGVVAASFPAAAPGLVANYTGQLWALRSTIVPDDLIVMPLKTAKSKIAMGVCTGGYAYRADEPDPDYRHTISVDWKTADISRTAIKQDLLNTLNGATTVFQASKNNAELRLRALLDTGADPGSNKLAQGWTDSEVSLSGQPVEDDALIVDPTPEPTLEAIRDRVRTYLTENFKGHDLTALVAEILRAMGYHCNVSSPGPDQGVDIIAGRGPLGLDTPTVIVEVKSQESPVGSAVARGLTGAMSAHNADQGLLVAWGGLTSQARSEIRTQRLRLQVWDAEDVLEQLFAVYVDLPEPVRAKIPLKRAWVLDFEAG